MVVENARRYKDRLSLVRYRGRLSPQTKIWRKAVFLRDNYTCTACGEKKQLHAHHIKHWASNEDARFDIDNGITLCEVCHGYIHGLNFREARITKMKNNKKAVR
jgi:5-methylcytosine-specific restriction endonuclease McrA